jgi:hypothetical protein
MNGFGAVRADQAVLVEPHGIAVDRSLVGRYSIIISVGYGKNRAGDLPLRFRPILSTGGRRRLNVAITRARETMLVVSSFSHLDIDATQGTRGNRTGITSRPTRGPIDRPAYPSR